MKERPILFSAPMVRAILEGRKTQTRRVVKTKHLKWLDEIGLNFLDGKWNQRPLPYGQTGDRLWVRETWFCNDYRVQKGPYLKPDDFDVDSERETGGLVYLADGLPCWEGEEHEITWKPSIHMPRWASRITLEVTGVRVERLQDISDIDAMAEGATQIGDCEGAFVAGFKRIWESINSPSSWAANPWVWVIEFRRLP
ncbi:MAG: hypothetical protein KGL39_47255 [Patescibacteria group bacterium]|nr:hypothetical protein [Patescibacteria group bacterium]